MSMTLFSSAIRSGTSLQAFSEEAVIEAMTRFEVALAQAQANCGLIPQTDAEAIELAAKTFEIDSAQLATDALNSASLPVPFVKAFSQHVAKHSETAAGRVHFGASTQDVIDTALVLCTQRALRVLDQSLDHAMSTIRSAALEHAQTPMLARTLMQPAGVTTVGYVLLQWFDAITRGRERIKSAAATALCVSLGGPTGQLNSYGEHGARIRAALAAQLGLRDPDHVWHVFRDDWITLAAALATNGSTLKKIAQDMALHIQSEVGEMHEAHATGKGASSSLPHKRNPTLTLRVLASAQPIPGYFSNLLSTMTAEHQRALGSWQSEIAQWPLLCAATLETAIAFEVLIRNVTFDVKRCRQNVDQHRGVLFSEQLTDHWTPAIGKQAAMQLVAQLCEESIRTQQPLGQLALQAVSTYPNLSLSQDSVNSIAQLFDVDSFVMPLARHVEQRMI